MMNYFKDNNNNIFAYDDEQVKQGYGNGLEEILSPIYEGKVLLAHKNISQVETKEDGTYYDFYNADGTVNAELQMQHDTTNLLQSIEVSIQDMIANKAKELGYDNIVSACSYAGYENEFQLEAIALGKWRSAVWSKAYELQSTMTTTPTAEEVLSQLPEFVG